MNCRPGDLVVIVRCTCESDRDCLGRIFRVIEPYEACGLILWTVEASKYRGANVSGIRDDCARPLRDPGEDAKDESLLWLPSPSREKETA